MDARLPLLLLVVTAGAAGCFGDEAPAAQTTPMTDVPAAHVSNASSPAPPPGFETVTLDLAGRIILRAAGDPVSEGDPPEFMLYVPNGTRSIVAHAEWSPPQIMGLEFQPPGGGERIRSWKGFPNTQMQPPIDVTIPGPVDAGEWWTYIGPSTVGGAVSWTLRLTLDVPQGEAAAVQVVGCRPAPPPATALC